MGWLAVLVSEEKRLARLELMAVCVWPWIDERRKDEIAPWE